MTNKFLDGLGITPESYLASKGGKRSKVDLTTSKLGGTRPFGEAQEEEETGFLDAALRGAKANAQGVLGGIGYAVGAEDFAETMQQYANDNARKREHDTVFSWDYITDPEGLTYDLGSNLGSMAALAPLALAVPQSAALAGAGLVGRGLGRVGLSKAAEWAATKAGQQALATGIRGAMPGIGESVSEFGSTAQQAHEEGLTPNPRLDNLQVLGQNLLVNPASSALEYMLLGGKLFNPAAKAGETLAQRAYKAPFRAAPAMGANAVQNGIEELVQQTISDKALGLPVGDIYNPSTWTDSQRQAFEVGMATGGVTAGASNVGQALMPNTKEEKAEAQEPISEEAEPKATANNTQQIDNIIDKIANAQTADYENIGQGKTQEQVQQEAFDKAMRDLYGVEPQKPVYPKYDKAEARDNKTLAPLPRTSSIGRQQQAEHQRQQLADVNSILDELTLQTMQDELKVERNLLNKVFEKVNKNKQVEPVLRTEKAQRTFNASDRVKRFIDTNNAFRNAPQTSVVAPQQEQTATLNQVVAEQVKTPVNEDVASEMTSNYNPSFTLNEKQNGIEIKFGEIPDGAFRDKMKEAGFKWSQRQRKWYSKQTDEAMQFAESIGYKAEQKPAEQEIVKEEKPVEEVVEKAGNPQNNEKAFRKVKQIAEELKTYYSGYVDTRFNRASKETKEETKDMLTTAIDTWATWQEIALDKNNPEASEYARRAKEWLDHIRRAFEDVYGRSEIAMDGRVLDTMRSYVDSVKDYFADKTATVEKPKAEEPKQTPTKTFNQSDFRKEIAEAHSEFINKVKTATTKEEVDAAEDAYGKARRETIQRYRDEYSLSDKQNNDNISYAKLLEVKDDSLLEQAYNRIEDSEKEEKPKAEANTFRDNPEALLNNDRISKLSTSEMEMINKMFDKEKGEVKKEETPKQVSEVEENDNGEEIIRGTSARDNSRPVGERPDTSRSDTTRSVSAPQGERNVGDGTGERRVHGEIEEELTPAQKKNSKPSEVAGHNFTITDDDNIGEGSEKTKYRNNVEAIKLLKQLEAENRLATPSEQKVLAKYVGWGGLSSVFSYGRVDPKWEAEAKELKELLTQEEYNAARASTTSAFYTPIDVTKTIWDIVERLGFKGGRVLEPSMGVGNFFGLMPENIRNKSALNGVELDSISGRIAQQLYQKANIEVTGYEKTQYPDDFFDLAISNVPFVSGLKPHDPKYNKYKLDIHNYFFAKSIDKVRSGGLICFITSTSTMQGDNDNTRIRELLATKADLVGAIRLPTGTFKGNAGTDVDADLIILQKREAGAEPSKFNKEWTKLVHGEAEGRYGRRYVSFNEYYENNPEMVIGEWKVGGRFDTTLVADGKGLDVAREIENRIENLPKNIYKPLTGKRNLDSVESARATFLAPSDTKANAYVEKNGKVFQNVDGTMVELPAKDQKKALDYVGLRDVVKKILAAQITPETTDTQLDAMRKELNKKYDEFVKKNGYVNETKNVKALALDPEYGIVSSIENYKVDKKTKKTEVKKNDIFTKRTVNAVVEINKADNASDALALSLTNTGAVNIDYIAKLMGKKPAEAVKSLEGLVYQNPATMGYETADEYLSGNVREKLEYAKLAAKQNKDYRKNVEALEKVQPKDLTPEEISVGLGTPWVPASDIEAFAANMLDVYRPPLTIKFTPSLGTWTVSWNNDWTATSAKQGVNNNSKWGTTRRDFKDVLDDALNQRSPIVYDTLKDGSKVVNQKETTLAQQKVREVQNEFKKWIWKDKERTERLTNFYNNNFNNWRLREYDGSHLTMQGYSAVEPPLKPHQKNAIWRIMQNMNTLIAHCVGAGKTWTMQAAAMEMKRLGIAKKSMFVIPNHMLKQFENEFRRIYPNAKLLTISSENLPDVNIPNAKKLSKAELEKRRAEKNAARQRVLSQIATEDWDGIIISHNMFKRIPMSNEAYARFYQEQVDEMRAALIELSASDDRSAKRLVKELEKKAASLEERLKTSMNEENKDIVIPFEQLGIDQLFVDEADMFKNLGFVTKMNRIAGLSNTNSQRSTDMFIKAQHITKMNGGRGVVFATGTPISNTMAEMFTMLRYLDMQGLKEKNMSFFDNWAANFAVHEPTVERSPDGQGYRQTEKFTSFMNMPELIKMFRKVADVKNQQELDLDIPKLKNGKPTVIEIEPNEALTNYIKDTVAKRANAIRNRAVDPSEDNMLKLTGDLRKASLDMRLVDPSVPQEIANGKIKAVADTVHKKWKETTDVKGAQLVFCDLSTPKGASDKVVETDDDTKESAKEGENVTAYEEIKKLLIKKGVPANQIAFIHDAKNKNQKEELFEKVRSGEVRVLIGSTEKMGAGTNIQKRLVALHHVDAPWRPRDIEQREGRILRQGNENKEVEIFNYVTKDSFDANMWEKLKNKATMINQAMSDNLSERIIEDADANVLNFAEVEALASGNPLMAERVMVNAELNKYETLRGNFTKQRIANERKALSIPAIIKQAEVAEKQAKADIKKRVDITGDNFNLLLGKKNYNNRNQAKETLEATVRNYKNEAGGIVGQIGGFDLRLRYVKAGGTFSRRGEVYTTHEDTVIAELIGNNVYGCSASLGSIENTVMKEPERVLDKAVKTQESMKKELKSLEAEIKRPFEYEDKYQKLKQRAEEIDKELNIGNENIVADETTSDTSPYGIIKEADELYGEVVEKYDDIANGNKVVQERVKEGIEATLDFGTKEGDVIELATVEAVDGRYGGIPKGKKRDIKTQTEKVKVLGFGITRKLVSGEVFSLKGKTIQSIQDLAEYAQILRHPGYEKFHRIYVNKDGLIIGHETVSAMLPTESATFTSDKDYYAHLRKIDTDDDIDKVYYIHNHPTTDVRPSSADITATQYLDQTLSKIGTHNKFGGHLILDTDKYAHIRGSGAVSYQFIPTDKQVNYNKIGVPHSALGEKLSNFDIFAKMVKNLDDTSKTTTFILDSKLTVRAVVQLPQTINKLSAQELSRYLERLTKRYYGTRIMVSTSDDIVYNNTLELVKRGYVLAGMLTKDRNFVGKDVADFNSYSSAFFGKKTSAGNVKTKLLLRESEDDYNTPSKNKIKGITVTTTPKTLKQEVKEQGYKGWFKGLWKDFYRNWVDKNDSLHALDEAMQMATGKPLAEKDKVYNRAQTMNATAAGRAQALIEGDGYHIKALSEQMGRKLHNVTLKKILEFISKDTMDKLFPNYLKDNDYDNWIDAFGHYLTARRLREMFRYQREVFEEKHAEWAKKKRVHEEWVRNGRQGKEPDKAGRELVYEPYKLPQDVTIEDIERAIRTAPAPFAEAAKMYYQFNDNLLTILEDAGIISKEVHELLNTKYREYCPLMRDFSDTAGADMFLNGLSNGGRGIANVSSTLKRISLEGSERGVINPLEVSVKSVAVMMNRAERNKVGQMAVRLAGEPGMENVIKEIPTPRGGNAVADPKNSIFTVMINGKKVAYQCAPELYGAIVGYNVPTAGFVLGVARSTARMLRTGATMSPSFIIRNLIRDTIFAGISSKNGFIPIVDTIRGAQALMNNPELKAEFETAGVSAFNFYKNAETAYKSLVELNGGKELNMRNPIDLIKFIARNFEQFSAFAESATRMGEFKRAREAGKSIEEATRDAKEITIDFSRSGVLGENVNLVVPFFNATIQGGDKLVRLFKENPVGTAVNVAKYIVLPSMLLWCMNYDDEEYKELDPKVKMTHWILGDIRIPKPQEAGIMFGSGVEAMLDLAAGKDPQAMKNWARQVIAGFLPNVLPTLILPLVEWQANYSFFRDGKLVGYREERLPDELQYKDSTSELSKGLGKLTGLSPIKLDNTVRGYTGTMGMLLWQAYDFTSMDKSKLPDKKLVELPLIRDFFVNDYNTRRSVDEFYKLAEQADKQHAGYGVKGKPNAVVQGIRKAKQQISNLNKDIRTITASNLSPVEKRERIDKKREYIKRIAQRANERYSKFYD